MPSMGPALICVAQCCAVSPRRLHRGLFAVLVTLVDLKPSAWRVSSMVQIHMPSINIGIRTLIVAILFKVCLHCRMQMWSVCTCGVT